MLHMKAEFILMVVFILGLMLIWNPSFLFGILTLLMMSSLIFLFCFSGSNVFFGLVILLVYVGGMLLLFMYASTLLGLWDSEINLNRVMIILLGLMFFPYISSTFYSFKTNYFFFSMMTTNGVMMLISSVLLSFSVYIMMQMLLVKSSLLS